MGAFYWLKLWLDMLDDPKIGTMPDYLFRRWIEFLLVAKEHNRDGLLPPVCDTAWRLRLSEEKVSEALRALARVGVVRESSDGWLIVNFAKRQKETSSTERVRQFREREKRNVTNDVTNRSMGETERYAGETELERNVTNVTQMKRTEEEEETEAEAEAEENAEGGGGLLPGQAVYPEWPAIPDAMTAERVFQQVTKMPTFPGRSRDNDIETICSLYDRHKAGTVEYLRPFWEAWLERNYNRVNTGWLDWAVSGQIPQRRNGRSGGHSPPRLDPDIGTDDPGVVEAFRYLKNNPRGQWKDRAIERLAEKGYRYDNGKLIKL